MWRAVFLIFLTGLPGFIGSAQEIPQRVTLSSIGTSGNKITRRSIILRELPVEEGQRIAVDSMAYYLSISKLRLQNLGIFTTIDITSIAGEADTVNWDI